VSHNAAAARGTVPGAGESGFGTDAFASTLTAAAAGSDWAWRTLVEHYSGALLGYLRLRAPGDPEDVLTETWISVASTIGSFVGDEPAFRSWLFVIAHRRAIDAARKASRQPVLVDRAHGNEVSTAELSAEDRAFADMSADSAMELLLGLTPDQRSVIALRVIADLSLAETAGILGKSVGAVKALQKRGLERLRRHLEQPVSSPSDPTITGLT
jgi:RNA polymerase sigma-70 factor (ECF subfamily)